MLALKKKNPNQKQTKGKTTKTQTTNQKLDPLCPKLCFIKLQVKRLERDYELLNGGNS